MILGLLAALALPAEASGPEVWAALYNGRLIDAADRDQGAAIAVYETLLADLPAEDPLRGELLLSLGRSQLDAGRREDAWATLTEAGEVGDAAVRREARRVLGHIQVGARRVRRLPLVEGFDTSPGPFVRGWTRGRLDDLAVGSGGDRHGPVLAWQVDVQAASDDFLRAELAPEAGPLQAVSLRLHAARFEAQVRILVEDAQGERWTAPVLTVPTVGWRTIALTADDFAPADAPAALRRPDPTQLRALEVRDVTGYHSTDRGENVLMIDDLELR